MKRPRWRLGDRVRVGERADEIGDPRYTGHVGTVVRLVKVGCGATRRDPLVEVRFERPIYLRRASWTLGLCDMEYEPGFDLVEHNGFWPEELGPWI